MFVTNLATPAVRSVASALARIQSPPLSDSEGSIETRNLGTQAAELRCETGTQSVPNIGKASVIWRHAAHLNFS